MNILIGLFSCVCVPKVDRDTHPTAMSVPVLLLIAPLVSPVQALVIPDEVAVESFFTLRQQLERFSLDLQSIICQPEYVVPFLQAGRLVRVRDKTTDWGWVRTCSTLPRGTSAWWSCSWHLPHGDCCASLVAIAWMAACMSHATCLCG